MPAGFEPATSAGLRPGTIVTGSGFDVLELLPPRAAERLRAMRLRTKDAHDLIPKFDDRHEINSARGDTERRLQRLLAPRSQGGFSQRENDREVVELRQQLTKLTDEARRLEELYEVRNAAWVTTSRALQAVEGWLRDGRPHGTVLEDFDGPEAKLLKGENSVLEAIENRRRRVRELRASLNRIASSCFPSSYCKNRMREMVEALAMQGAPSVSNLVEHDRRIEFATQRVQSEIVNSQVPTLGFAEVSDAVALVAWLHRDALIKRLDAEIDAEADDQSALSHEARQMAEAEVMGDLLAVERDESTLVFSAQAQGLPVEHRADCSPLAILQLRLVQAPRSNGSGR